MGKLWLDCGSLLKHLWSKFSTAIQEPRSCSGKTDSTFVHLGRDYSVYYDEGCFNMIDVHPFTVMRYHPACLGVYLTQCH